MLTGTLPALIQEAEIAVLSRARMSKLAHESVLAEAKRASIRKVACGSPTSESTVEPALAEGSEHLQRLVGDVMDLVAAEAEVADLDSRSIVAAPSTPGPNERLVQRRPAKLKQQD